MHNIKLQHVIEDEIIAKEVDNASFLMTNKNGSYLTLASCTNISRFQGCFLYNQNKVFKIIETIQLDLIPTKITNNFSHIIQEYGSAFETFTVMNGNAFLYEVENYSGNIQLVLDCREIYDYNDEGRIYSIKKENDIIIIEYTKYQNKELKKINYKLFIAIKGLDSTIQYESINKWIKKEYSYDKQRNSQPFELFVFDALRIPVKKKASLIIAYSLLKNEAIEKAEYFYENKEEYVLFIEDYNKILVTNNLKIKDKEISMAYKCSIKALDDLIIKNEKNEKNKNEKNNKDNIMPDNSNLEGIFAGYPWFFQVWSRDETISLIGLIKQQKFMESKAILMKTLEYITYDGRLPNKINKSEVNLIVNSAINPAEKSKTIENNNSADSIGLLFKRISDLIKETKLAKQYNQYFSDADIYYIKDQLLKALVRNIKYHSKNGFASNDALETWMDTTIDKKTNDTREGARIEIQALRLCMIKVLLELCEITNDEKRKKLYLPIEKQLALRVKKAFFVEDKEEQRWLLKDEINDKTIRPNIFLAYYIYPELLSNNDWEKAFDTALQQLWLEWGGLATIDKTSKYFSWDYTGENNKSYHRGDSWYFINNIAAICLARLNRKKYDYAIQKILEASANDILWHGFAGHASELSSAKESKAEGCLSQAWSAGTFIELVNELFT